VVHRPSGLVIVPSRCPDRLGTSKTKNTQILRRVAGGVHVEELTHQHGRGLGAQEQPPGRVGVPDRNRRYPPPLQNAADGERCHAMAKLEQLALNSLVSPAGILPGMRLISSVTASETGRRLMRCG
jgi:hypothetical protein